MTTPDPRPQVVHDDDRTLVEGRRCTSCGEVTAHPWPACPACGGAVEQARFGPEGTVWSATLVRIPTPGRTPPYGLAYVDLDDGPRVLAHTAGAMPIGARVRLGRDGDDLTAVARW